MKRRKFDREKDVKYRTASGELKVIKHIPNSLGLDSKAVFLKRHKVDEDTPESEVDELKAMHQKYYDKAYYKARRKKNGKRFTLRFTQKEFQVIQNHFDRASDNSLNHYIVRIITAYLNQHYVLYDENKLKHLQSSIRKIAIETTNIRNVIYRKVNRFSEDEIGAELKLFQEICDFLIKEVQNLETIITTHVISPSPNLLPLITEMIQTDPRLIVKIRGLINQFDSPLNSSVNAD